MNSAAKRPRTATRRTAGPPDRARQIEPAPRRRKDPRHRVLLTDERAPWLTRLADPNRLTVALLVLTFMAGGFSLHRIDPELRRFGELAYVRTWLVFGLIGLLVAGRRRRVVSPPELAAAALFTHAVAASQLYIGLTALWSVDAEGTFPRVFGQILLALLLELALAAVGRSPSASARLVLDLSLAAALVYAAAGLAGGSEHGRMSMFFGGPNVFIRVIGAGILAAVYRALATRRLAWLWPVPLLLICAIESGSRGGMLALLFTLPVLAWAIGTSGVLRRRPAWWLAAPLVGSLAAAGAGAYVLARPEVRSYVEERYLVYAPSSYDAAEADFGNRDRLFAAALETFLRNPAAGSGLSAIGDFERLDAHPHNLFLATARDGGLVGLALLSIPFLLLAVRLRRPLSVEQRMALAMGFFYLLAAQFSGTYYDCRFMWLYFLLAMLPAPPRRNRWKSRN